MKSTFDRDLIWIEERIQTIWTYLSKYGKREKSWFQYVHLVDNHDLGCRPLMLYLYTAWNLLHSKNWISILFHNNHNMIELVVLFWNLLWVLLPQCPHWEYYISISFHIEWDMIVVTVFLSILNQMEVHLVQKIERKTVTHDHIPFKVKGNGNRVFSE